jgi:hypothetical protein
VGVSAGQACFEAAHTGAGSVSRDLLTLAATTDVTVTVTTVRYEVGSFEETTRAQLAAQGVGTNPRKYISAIRLYAQFFFRFRNNGQV